ncbi:MAG TPA: DUF4468 domain-containing protein [Bacteroidales bacterium]|nr:DUF4468 domain-containing protein [Bacteroidales bacterium]
MRKVVIIIVCVLISINIKAQENFKWEKTDSIAKTKAQIYSDTKMYIANVWKSAQSVIQNDDKEAGNIVVKGLFESKHFFSPDVVYFYGYTVTFKMKDNRYKINIDNVHCDSYRGQCTMCVKIEPFEGDNFPRIGCMVKKQVKEIMNGLKAHLGNIINDYDKYIKSPSNIENW